MINQLALSGYLHYDGAIAQTRSGACVVNAYLNCTRGKHPLRVPITAFDDVARRIYASCVDGDRIVITGELRQSTWVADDGSERSKLYVNVSRIENVSAQDEDECDQ